MENNSDNIKDIENKRLKIVKRLNYLLRTNFSIKNEVLELRKLDDILKSIKEKNNL
jgi:hypothetical protein